MIEITQQAFFIFSHLAVALIFLFIGYSMGKPYKEKISKPKENKDAISEPEGDLFNDLLEYENEQRVETIK